ncbi:GntR family transcriptional regulator [Anoxybacillus vitaminiphilus]|jgi:DNA-binding GntR family transcriptional regulator|uniref:GntR family transcriptional regulator n=1 Tax=Paranoxybacillus vitaminiphilus TaxID=581036 RepID=A0A327YJG6_9BACL|nr:GntR family transcriptional regulator [Anoxybacillus vitaminiphilus]RAK20522.1 GntR family transcriptional regulator [Anoxybacillus vitaminiphilus]
MVEKSPPFYDQIYHSLRQMIFQGVFRPGERIYEAKLAREFNVSRSPVREAVRALEKEGLLTVDDKSRITVYQPTMKDVEEIYQCRMVLESLAARLAAQQASNEELKEIEKVLEQTQAQIEKQGKDDTVIALNVHFHDLIVQFSQNRRLQKQLQELRSLTYYYRAINFQGEGRERQILREHQHVFQLIKERDAERAAKAMAEHIHNDLLHLQQVLQGERGKTEGESV